MLLVFGCFMVLEPGEHPAKEGFDLLPEHPNRHQCRCQASDDSLKDNATSSRVNNVEMGSSRQTQKKHGRNKRQHH